MECSRLSRLLLASALMLGAAAAAAAQPKFIHTSNASDITADGNTVIGQILDANVDARIHVWTRGVGHSFPGVSLPSIDGRLLISGDGQFASGGIYNGFFPPQNPSFGNYNPNSACCNGNTCTVTTPAACTGIVMNGSCSPSPCPGPTDPGVLGACCAPNTAACTVTTRSNCLAPSYWVGNWQTCGTNICKRGHFIAHRMTIATGSWQNAGSFPNIGGLGAAYCDANINTPYGLSADGRFITGGGWYGSYGTTACNTRGFVYDSSNGTVLQLPMIGTGCQPFSQGERISADGNVVMGSDSHESPDPDGPGPMGPICNARCLTVWERNTVTGTFLASGRTVLDDYGAGGLSSGAMNRAGNVIAMSMTATQATVLNIPEGARNLYKRVKNTLTGEWERVNLGRCIDRDSPCVCMRPAAVSDDGNTIIGNALYGSFCGTMGAVARPFIWSTTINEGVPIDLQDYLDQINGSPFATIAGLGQAISADGRAMVAAVRPLPSNCPTGFGLNALTQSGVLYLDGGGIGCEPPRIAGGPYSKIQEEYTPFGIVGNVFASGTFPMQPQWQKEVPDNSNNWVNLTDSCGQFEAQPTWIYEGTTGFQLRINMLAPAAQRDGRYRVVITNPCGSATSQVATIGVRSGACCYVEGGVLTCSIEIPSRCTGSRSISYFLGGIYRGDNTTCEPTTCEQVAGACCFGPGGPGAQCVVTIATNCTDPFTLEGYDGSFVGAGTTCSPASCAVVSGACCYSPSDVTDVVCTSEVAAFCSRVATGGNGLSGAYLGSGTTCGPTSCNTVAGACCFSPSPSQDLICRIHTQTRCTNLPQNPSVPGYINGVQGIYVGNGTTCLPLNQQCGFVAGACCHSITDESDAVCTLQTQDRCTRAKNNSGLGGTYRGDGTTCQPASCTTVTGACCYSTFSSPGTLLCTIQPQTRCTSRFNAGGLFGVYLGAGTTCSPTACSAVVGACCHTLSSGTCVVCTLQPNTSPANNRCTDPVNGGLGGTYSGPGTVCSLSSCGGTQGACCIGTTCLAPSCADECAGFGGIFRQGVACTPTNPCETPPQGACCRGATCSLEEQGSCTGFATSFSGNGTVCNTFGVNNVSPCCFADFNRIGGVTVQDIFDFLAAYFGSDPRANINGGTVSVQDIFDYLAVYFAGCS